MDVVVIVRAFGVGWDLVMRGRRQKSQNHVLTAQRQVSAPSSSFLALRIQLNLPSQADASTREGDHRSQTRMVGTHSITVIFFSFSHTH